MIRRRRATERRRSTLAAAVLAFGAALLAAPPADADDASLAEQLFLEGRKLMVERRYEEACAKFKAAHDLDKTATGTLLNLALCHELTGRPASAWAELRQVAAESEGRRQDRVDMAREHIAKLLPTLSYLTLVVADDARAPGLALKLDEAPVAEAAWNTEFPVDPGAHVVVASAPGKKPWRRDVVVGTVGDRQRLVVAPLVDAPPEEREAALQERADAARRRRTIGLALGGVGLVAAGVGVAFGVSAAAKNHDATTACQSDVCPNQQTLDKASSDLSAAKTQAILSDVFVGAGALAFVGGVVLVLTARPPQTTSPATSAMRIAPAFLPGGGALLVGGDLR